MGAMYIVSVKAANSNLNSSPTNDLAFFIPKAIAKTSTFTSEVQITIAVIFAALSVLGLVVIFWVVRKKNIVFVKMKDRVDMTVGFENPAFHAHPRIMDDDVGDLDDDIEIRHLDGRSFNLTNGEPSRNISLEKVS